MSAPQLGSIAIKASLERSKIGADAVNEVIMGNVISSNIGQAPARQAAIGAGLPPSVVCTTVNKVCSSGLKAIMMASNEIKLGHADVVVAGGFESMTNTPYYAPAMRSGARLGDSPMVDGLMKDGLTDAYGKFPMGNCAEVCADEMKFSREDQDNYAIQSYSRAQKALQDGKFKAEIVPVEIKSRKGVTVVDTDEEPFKVSFDKVPALKPVFKNPHNAAAPLTVTAANASVISDGAASVVLCSGKYAKEQGLDVVARVLGYADHEQEPVWFTTAPAEAVKKALKRADVTADKVNLYELNEAFSVVALANQKLLDIPADKINVYGGAVSLGHPLGASGARIVVTLLSALKQEHPGSAIGVAGICNGGGGASALVLETMQ
jgi:acetyl-CoA C-acetyltransferase